MEWIRRWTGSARDGQTNIIGFIEQNSIAYEAVSGALGSQRHRTSGVEA